MERRDEPTVIPVEQVEEILPAAFNQNISPPYRLNGMNGERVQ